MLHNTLHHPQNRVLFIVLIILLIITSQLVFASGLNDTTAPTVIRANDADFIVQETLDLSDTNPGDGICNTAYGTCSLRAAITEANMLAGEQRIYILPGTFIIRYGGGDDTNAYGDLDITDDLILSGYGMSQTLIEEVIYTGNSYERIFDVDPLSTDITVTIANLAILTTDVSGDAGSGIRNRGNLTIENVDISNSVGDSMIYNAGTLLINRSRFAGNSIDSTIYNHTGATMTIRDTLITRNRTPYSNRNGAGIYNRGTLTIENTTLSYNEASALGGAILNSSASITMNFVTLFGNRGATGGAGGNPGAGGFYNVAGTMTISNSLIAGNTGDTGNIPSNCSASSSGGTPTLISGGHNLIAGANCMFSSGDTASNIVLSDVASALLDTQADYGGGTETIPLLPGSPALDAANPTQCLPTDQRGATRPAACDIGAFERVSDTGALFAPTVIDVAINGITIEAQNLYPQTTAQIAITFSENVINPAGNSEPDDVTNPANYRLFSAGANRRIESLVCDTPRADDSAMAINSVAYDTALKRATLHVNNGTAVPNGMYALLVCGTTSIVDSHGNALDGDANGAGGDDYLLPFQLASVGETPQPGPVFYVNVTTDDVPDDLCSTTHCTLRDAARDANSLNQDTTIHLPAGTYALSQTYPALDESLWGDIDLLNNITLQGAGANQTIIDGNGIGRVIYIGNDGNVIMRHITVRGGDAIPEGRGASSYYGGGIFVYTGSLAVYDSVIRDNYTLAGGGGIVFTDNGKLVTIQRSAIINNEAEHDGGGLVIHGVVPGINIINTTISGNVSRQRGGGLYFDLNGAAFDMQFVTIADNVAYDGGSSVFCWSSFPFNIRNNIISNNTDILPYPWHGYCEFDSTQNVTPTDVAGISTLADNGGATLTYALAPFSDAVGSAVGECPATDQRGVVRSNNGCDMGAYEASYPPTIVQAAIVPAATEVTVTFSEAMDNASVTTASNYRLVNTGVDSIFTTKSCAAAQGDDVLLPVNTVRYDALTRTATVSVNNGSPLAYNFYRIIVCSGVNSASGQALDGNRDGIGGDDGYETLYYDTAQSAPEYTATVTDDGYDGVCGVYHCTVREALLAAHNDSIASIVHIPAGTYYLTRMNDGIADELTVGDLDIIGGDLQIIGAGADVTIIDAQHIDRVLDIKNMQEISIAGITIQNGEGRSAGGIYVETADNFVIRNAVIRNNVGFDISPAGGIAIGATTALIENTTVSGNKSVGPGSGGGIQSTANLTLNNVTISDNEADWWGGGLAVRYNVAILNHVTLVNNVSNLTLSGNITSGGLHRSGGTVRIHNSLIAHNTNALGLGFDCSGSIISEGGNLIANPTGCTLSGDTPNDILGESPFIGGLANNGGSTPTHALLNGSPAINAAIDDCSPADQRGMPRVGNCDIGAYEYSTNALPAVPPIVVEAEAVEVNEQLTGAIVIFSKPMTSSAANPASYWLVNAGADQILQTSTCASTQGDDQSVPITDVFYNAGTYQATLTFTPATIATFRFFVCATLTDTDGNLLDGDANGTAGDAFYTDWMLDPQQTGDYYVTTPVDGDDGVCSVAHCTLREAVNTAPTDTIIHIPANTYTLALGSIVVDKPLVLSGAGAATTILESVGGRAFNIAYEGSVTTVQDVTFNGSGLYADANNLIIRNAVFENGSASNGGGLAFNPNYPIGTLVIEDTVFNNNSAINGGALWVDGYAAVEIYDSAFVNNTADYGGAIWVDAEVELINSTISNNTASVRGGAIHYSDGSTSIFYILHSTITQNSAPTGGGIFAQFPYAEVPIGRSILYDNTGGDCSALSFQTEFQSLGYNIFGDMGNCEFYGTNSPWHVPGTDISGQDLLLEPLSASNGTFIHELQEGSPAWDAIPLPHCLSDHDQLNAMRPINANCDIGAVEMGGTPGIIAPFVTQYNYSPDTTSTPLVLVSTLTTSPKRLLVTFSQAMSNPNTTNANSVSNPNNYRLFEAGTNLTFDTVQCGTAQGDDAAVTWSALTYSSTSRRTTLTVNPVLAEGRYRLIVCDTLTDTAATGLDGDNNGLPGGNAVTEFTVTFPPKVTSVAVTDTQATLIFSEVMQDPAGDSEAHDVTNPANYGLLTAGVNGTFETDSCGVLQGDDIAVSLASVTYTSATRTAVVDYGQVLPYDNYRLFVCDNLLDAKSFNLDGEPDNLPGGDFVFNFMLYDTSDSNILVVNTNTDTNDGICDAAHCSLREAVTASNTMPGTQQVHFNLSGVVPYTITLSSFLPPIEDQIILDGTTQPGFAGTPVVVITGNTSFGAFSLSTNGDNSTFRGLVLNNLKHGISMTWGAGTTIENNYIGTDYTGTQAIGNTVGIWLAVDNVTISNNLISGNTTGINISQNYNGNQIIGNLIGTDVTGTQALGNVNGINTLGGDVQIGGTTAAERNIISGNIQHGIIFPTQSVTSYAGTVIEGNYIGLDVSGTYAIGNGNTGIYLGTTAALPIVRGNVISGNGSHGVYATGHSTGDYNILEGNFIGTDASGLVPIGNGGDGIYATTGLVLTDNVIAGNTGYGLYMTSRTARLLIEGNAIGTDASGTLPVGNGLGGIFITQSNGSFALSGDEVRIGGLTAEDENIIAYNNGNGITITSIQNRYNNILHNRIYDNAGLGIDLSNDGVTLNDNLDADSGPNNQLNYPVLSSAVQSDSNIIITGQMHTTTFTTITLDFYGSPNCDVTSHGEGAIYLGSQSVSTVGTGNAAISVSLPSTVPIGNYVTAIAKDPSKNSSEFSNCVEYITSDGLAAPLNVRAEVSSANVMLTWVDISADETGFSIERSSDNGATWTVVGSTAANSETYMDTFADCTLDYLYRVQAVRSAGSVVSAYATLATPIEPICPPSGFAVDTITSATIELLWDDVEQDVSSIELEISEYEPDAVDPTSTNTVSLGAASRDYSANVLCERRYEFRLRAYRDNDSVYSEYTAVVEGVADYCVPQLAIDSVATSETEMQLVFDASFQGFPDNIAIERSSDDGASWTEIAVVAPETTQYVDTDLTCGTSYQYRLRAVHGVEYSEYGVALEREVFCNIPTPTNLRLLQTTTSTTSLRLQFDQPVYPNSDTHYLQYYIERSLDNGATWGQLAIVNPPYYTIGNICSTQMYRVRAYRLNDNTFSPYSATIFSAGCPPDLSATRVAGQGVNLIWIDRTAGATGFSIERSDTSNIVWQEIASVGAGVTSYLDDNLDCNLIYRYRMRAIVGGQYTAYSFQQERQPLCNLIAPDNVTIQTNISNQLTLSWNDPNPNNNATLVERSIDDGTTWTEISSVDGSSQTYSDISVLCETDYQYRLRAYRSADDSYSPYSSIAIANSGVCNGANFRVTSVDTAQIVLAWDDVSTSENGYQLERFSAATAWEFVTLLPANTVEYADTDITCDTHYEYRLRTYRDSDTTVSNWIYTLAYAGCTLVAPSNLTVTATAYNSLNLTWTDNSTSETAFVLEQSVDGGTNWHIITQLASGSTSTTLSNRTCETNYSYRIRAYRISDGQYSPYSDVAADSTWLCPPTNVAAAALTDEQTIRLTWQDVSVSETQYHIERSPDGVAGWVEIATVGADTTLYDDTSLACQTPYYYRVRTYRSSDTSFSPYSEIVNASANCLLLPPSGVTSTGSIYNQISLQWTDPNLNEDVYLVERSDNFGNTWTQIAVLPANTTTYNSGGLTCETTYQHRLRAYRNEDNTYSTYSTPLTASTNNCLQTGSVFTVNTTADVSDGYCEIVHCSLREAFIAAQSVSNSTISIPAGTYTFTTTSNLLVTSANMTVQGAGANATILDFNSIGRGILVNSNSLLTIADISVLNVSSNNSSVGVATGSSLWIEDSIVQGGNRGGISASGHVTVLRSVISDNLSTISGSGIRIFNANLTVRDTVIDNNTHVHTGQIQYGGGIYHEGTGNLLIENSTISRNGLVSTNDGTGIALKYGNSPTASARIVNTTISGNGAIGQAAIWLNSWYTNLELEHTTVTNNYYGVEIVNDLYTTVYLHSRASIISGNTNQNVIGTMVDLGYNIIGGDALLGILQDNGGLTDTHALLDGSPALNIVPSNECTLLTDQRGFSRPGAGGCDAGAYERSEVLAPLPAPTALTVAAVDPQTVNLSWVDNATNESAYYVERSTDGGTTWTQIATLGTNATTYSDTVSACLAATYHYRVQAYRLADNSYSDYSNVDFADAIVCSVPQAPDNLMLTGVGDYRISLNWANHEPYASSVLVERSVDGGSSWTLIATLAATSTNFNDNTVVCGQMYDYQVRAYRANDDSYSPYSTSASLTLDCPAPTNVQTSIVEDSFIRLTWVDNLFHDTNYDVERSTDGGTTWTLLVTLPANSTGYDDTDVTCASTYAYRVRGYVSTTDTYSPYSDVAMQPLPCPVPTNLAATVPTVSSVNLTWTDNMTTETAYRVERSSDDGTTWTQIASIGANSVAYTDNNLACEQALAYRVRAYRSSDGFFSDYSNTANVITGTCPVPRPPDNVAALGIAPDSISITWTDTNLSVVTYRIERAIAGSGNWFETANVAAGLEAYVDAAYSCNQTFNYRMRTYRIADGLYSPYTNVVTATTLACPPLDPPPAPVINAPERGSASLILPATSDGDIDTYTIERRNVSTGASWLQVAVVPATTTNYADSGLSCETYYSYRLRGYRPEDASYSPYSAETQILTAPCPIPVTNTVGLYRNGVWMFSDINATNGATIRFNFGPQEAGWTALTGDWDGDGVDGIGLYKDGLFILRNVSTQGTFDFIFRFGVQESGWQPIVGDWNGDDVDTIGVYREGQFLLRDSNNAGTPDYRFRINIQQTGWQATAGDWNASGWDAVGIYKNGTFYLTNSLDSMGILPAFQFGPVQTGWRALAGDWNADGTTTIGLYNQSIWRLRNSNDNGNADIGFNFGGQEAGWQPLASYRGGAVGLAALAQSAIEAPVRLEATPIPTAMPLPEVTPEATEPVLEASATPEPIAEATVIPTEPTATPTASMQPTVEVTPTATLTEVTPLPTAATEVVIFEPTATPTASPEVTEQE